MGGQSYMKQQETLQPQEAEITSSRLYKMDLNSKTFREFLRYSIVGGVSFLADTGVMVLSREIIFRSLRESSLGLFFSVAAGFLFGLTVNYFLSQYFVFISDQQKVFGRKFSAFLRFAVIGLIGFGLTELGMYLGVRAVGQEGYKYVLVKCVVAGLVLIWNYLGRKLWVYKGT
jgi:putative flippase GtrA